jgi:thiamine biosynthesis lipoprotein
MASPCEVLVDTDDRARAETALRIAKDEASRIEAKFSRYRRDNIVHRINHAEGGPVTVDEETAGLLDYAATCHELSGGRFDVTSGVLRRVWTFDGSDRVPTEAAIADALRFVGWNRIVWKDRMLTMPAGMEIDLGAIGKEYAVDRAAALVAEAIHDPFLVNFGGDLVASGSRRGKRPWGGGSCGTAESGWGTSWILGPAGRWRIRRDRSPS